MGYDDVWGWGGLLRLPVAMISSLLILVELEQEPCLRRDGSQRALASARLESRRHVWDFRRQNLLVKPGCEKR